MASSTGLRGGRAKAIHPFALRAGSLISGVDPLEVVTCTGTAPLAVPDRASIIWPDPLSQASEATGCAPITVNVAVDRPPLTDHSQLPGVCGASRQSAGAGGKGFAGCGRGAGAGSGAAGGTTRGAAQLLSAPSAATTNRMRDVERFAFTCLLWKERGR